MTFLAPLLALATLGGTFDPAQTNAPSPSRIYPIGAPSVFRLVRPDGGMALFRCVDDESGTLLGDRPWVGKRQKGRIDVWTDPSQTGGKVRAGYTFLDGLLRHMEIDGTPYDFPTGNPFADHSSDALFTTLRPRETAKGSSGDIWNLPDGARLRLWFANPNCAGLLFVQIALLALVPLVVPQARKWVSSRPRIVRFGVVAVSSLIALASLYGLLRTGSRGALAGLLVGLACLALPHLRSLLTRRGLALSALAALAFVGLVTVSGQGSRLIDTCRRIDAGNALRLKIAKASTALLADAPFGWQGGDVPVRRACLNWYVMDEPRTIRTHLVTIAELGWFGGGAYLAGWLLLLGLGVRRLSRHDPMPLAVVASFFVAGFLNPVYRSGELWVLPGILALVSAARERPWSDGRRTARLVVGSVVVAAVAVAGLVACGTRVTRVSDVSVTSHGRATLVNGGSPKIWVVEDIDVLGGFGFPGREILASLRTRPDFPAIGFVASVADLPPSVDTLALPGRAAADFLARLRETGETPCRARRIVFLSPKARPDDVPDALLADSEVRWFVGSLAALRESTAYRERRPWVRLVRGCELYLPNWLDLVRADNFRKPPKGKAQ